MENHQVAAGGGIPQSRHVDASRPSLGFPLGTALLLIIIFSLSGFFSCCYHWDKLRSLRRSFSPDGREEDDTDLEIQSPSSKPSQIYPNWKQNTEESMPVIMPGDKIAKFIALPCPCEPFRPDKVVIEVQSMQQTPPPPPPPPPPPQTLVYNHVARFGVHYNGTRGGFRFRVQVQWGSVGVPHARSRVYFICEQNRELKRVVREMKLGRTSPGMCV